MRGWRCERGEFQSHHSTSTLLTTRGSLFAVRLNTTGRTGRPSGRSIRRGESAVPSALRGLQRFCQLYTQEPASPILFAHTRGQSLPSQQCLLARHEAIKQGVITTCPRGKTRSMAYAHEINMARRDEARRVCHHSEVHNNKPFAAHCSPRPHNPQTYDLNSTSLPSTPLKDSSLRSSNHHGRAFDFYRYVREW